MVATHRTAVLEVVNRIIVVDGGNIVMDGAKDIVLARLRAGAAPPAPSAAPPAPLAGQPRVVVRRVVQGMLPDAAGEEGKA